MEDYTTRERAEYSKGKTPIIAKYSDEHSKLFAEIAGRGFLQLPGYAYDAENGIELSAKMQLSDLNYKILAETIDRELKQTGIDYGIEYKVAAMAWELEKQVLMVAWEAEYASIKQGMASTEEVLNMISIEVSKRAITLLNAKTVIEIAMEADRKAIAVLDGTAAPYEVQLANAKLLTAQKKLELIPIIETIITKEQELLVIEQQKAATYTDLVAAEQLVATKKQTLTPFVNELAAVSDQYANAIPGEILTEQQIANEKLLQSESEQIQAADKVQELNAEIATEGKQIELLAAKRALEVTTFNDDQTVIAHEKTLERVYQDDMMADFNKLITDETNLDATVISNKGSIHTIENQTKLESVGAIVSGEILAHQRITEEEVREKQAVANIVAATRLTASLEHIIG
jgi:hypothetical protein